MNISKINFGREITGSKTLINRYKEKKEDSVRSLYNLPEGVTVDKMTGYYPNFVKLTPDDIFDIQFASGTKLSDGAVILRPVNLSLGNVDIKPSKSEKYKFVVSCTPLNSNGKTYVQEMTEDELINNKNLCKGTITRINDNDFFLSYIDLGGKERIMVADKAGCIKTLKDNLLYI